MKIPVNTPVFWGNEKKYLIDCIDTGWISSAGKYITEFEEGMAKYVGMKYGVAVSSGTAALEAAVLSLNLPPNSEVILPDFTIISCVQAIVKAGLIPVPIDCMMDTWNIDADKIEEKINSKTKAIMIVHIYGLPVDMNPIWELATKYNLIIIEDAAEAHGLTYNGKQCGGLGDISVFSFFPNKHITTGEGGMVLTNNENYYERTKKIRNLFFDEERRYIHEEFGSNFRMTNLQAAIGVAQLEQINATIKKKREIGSYYFENLEGITSINLPVPMTEYAQNIFWVFGIVLKDNDRLASEVMNKLEEYGIGTRHFFYPIHKQPALIKSNCCMPEYIEDTNFSNSNFISEHGFYIPSGLGISIEEQKYVISVLKKIL